MRKAWFVLPVLIFIASAVFAEDVKQETPKPGEKVDRLTVRAIGCAKTQADFATLHFTLIGENEDGKDAQRILTKRVQMVKEHLKLPTVAPVNTFSITVSIHPQMFRYSQKDGYTYTSRMAIHFWKIRDISDCELHEKITTILDELNEIGVPGEAITTIFDVEQPEELSAKAYKLAIENARARAQPMAEAAGRKLGRISLVSDETRSVKSTELYGITDTSSSDSVVDRRVTLYVEFELE